MSAPQTIRAGKVRLAYVDDSHAGNFPHARPERAGPITIAKGDRITDRDEIDRLNRIALPPAYIDAWFCPSPDGHILATGIDARGRKQYRYNPDFRSHRDSEKFDNTACFGRLLPLVRKRVEDDLRGSKLTRDRAIASVVRLLDTGGIRIGNAAYARDNKSFGATTLRMRHAEVKGTVLKLRFKAKSGQLREMTITDKSLTRFVKAMQDLPGQQLFQYIADDGNACPIGSGDVNDYLREAMGEDFTAKHFRTFHASALGLQLLAEAEGTLTIKALSTLVAEHLGNTPTIARKSYIHPAVLALIDSQIKWRAKFKPPRATRWLAPHERALIALLEKGPKAAKLLAA